MITVEVVDNLPRLLHMEAEWSAFADTIPYLTPFQTPEWLLTWWRHFGGGDLRVFVFRDENNLIVGIIPCFRHEWNGARQLTLIGSGISDYLEPAIAPGSRAPVTECVSDFLRTDSGWDVCDWQDLSFDTTLKAVHLPEQSVIHFQPDAECSEIPIGEDFSVYWNERPSGLRRNVRRYREKAQDLSAVEFCTTHFDRECLEALIRLHSARWREHREPGMIAANRSADFIRDVAGEFHRHQRLLFFALKFQGEIAAVIMAFPFRRIIYAYLSAFDPSHAALGFGRTLLAEAIRYVFNERYAAWNFLRGSEPYKADWGAITIPKSRLIIRREPA